MKLIFHAPGHHKNVDGIMRMCKSRNIDLEITNDDSRVFINNYDILVLNSRFIKPSDIPKNIKIIYGPQHWVFPSGDVLGNPDPSLRGRCVYNTLSTWNEQTCNEFPSVIMPYGQFPYAVDIDKFNPGNKEKTFDCIVYIKGRSEELTRQVLSIVQGKRLDYKIIKYGQYNEDAYLDCLQQCKFMVVVDGHESQGFALEEAMSCNVPLLVLDATTMYDEYSNGRIIYESMRPKKLLSTSVPYWSDKCGIKITALEELHAAIDNMVTAYIGYRPREFIVETLSHGVCMDRILTYFDLHV